MRRTCVNCQTEFESKRQTAQYCSSTCRVEYNRSDEAKAKESLGIPTEVSADWVQRLNDRFAAKGLPLVADNAELYHFIPTGIAELDSLTKPFDINGVGGLPRKRITEIFGPNRSGKSSLVKLIMKHNPQLKVVFFDAEGGMIAPPKNLMVIKENIVENIGKQIVEIIQEGEVDLIVVDSVASLVTQKQFDDDPEGKASMARALNPEIKRIVAHLVPRDDEGRPLEVPGTALLFINQLRSTTQAFGAMEYTVGGNSLPYFASLRIEFRSASADKIKKKVNGKEMLVGQKVRATVKKSRFGPVDVMVTYPMLYDTFKDFDEYYQEQVSKLL